jgi:hypothetical protein
MLDNQEVVVLVTERARGLTLSRRSDSGVLPTLLLVQCMWLTFPAVVKRPEGEADNFCLVSRIRIVYLYLHSSIRHYTFYLG